MLRDIYEFLAALLSHRRLHLYEFFFSSLFKLFCVSFFNFYEFFEDFLVSFWNFLSCFRNSLENFEGDGEKSVQNELEGMRGGANWVIYQLFFYCKVFNGFLKFKI